ncbi:MAG: SprB repeat-containing protein, partial [Saprospiraceae bacterium]|nr:SprB repeat-containing protein [Saprospiraceae bacterium]
QLTVTDANGCHAFESVTLTEPSQLFSSINGTDESAPGANDGNADLIISGGTSPYLFAWSNGEITEDIFDLAGNGITYHVSVTDDKGCFTLDSITIHTGCLPAGTTCDDGNPDTYHDLEDGSCSCTGIPCPAINLNGISSNVSCSGLSDGIVKASPSGGAAPYSFLWSTGAITDSITHLMAGSYQLTVTDANGCNAFESVTLTEPSQLFSSINGTDESAPGANDGSADLSISGGTSPYQVAWSNGEIMEDIFNLAGNGITYRVSVTDDNGCLTLDSVAIHTGCLPAGTTCDDGNPDTYHDLEDGNCHCTGIPCPAFNLNGISSNVSCSGLSDGIVKASPSGGAAPYSFLWSTGAITDSITHLMAGSYQLTVTDANGCHAFESVTLTEPSQLFSSINGTDESAPGTNDGSADLSISGGTSPYQVAWSNGEITEDIFNLAGNGITYRVSVTDANGCLTLDSVAIHTGCLPAGTPCDDGNPDTYHDLEDGSCHCTGVPCPAINLNLTSSNVSCSGLSDGNAKASPFGGTAPYSFLWSTGAITDSITHLVASSYQLTVTDANGCRMSASFQIDEPPPLMLNYFLGPESSQGAVDGIIELEVTGGKMPYLFSWSNGYITSNLNALAAGQYEVVVTDANGCLESASIQLPRDSQECRHDADSLLTFLSVRQVSAEPCTSNSGQIFLDLGEMSDHFRFSIDGGETFQEQPYFIDLWNGRYSLALKDKLHACSYQLGLVELGMPEIDPPSWQVRKTDATNCSTSNGQIEIEADSIHIYEFSIDVGQSWNQNPAFIGIRPGPYTVLVRKRGERCTMLVQHQLIIGPFVQSFKEVILEIDDQKNCKVPDGQIAITGLPSSSYMYSLDQEQWQESPVFTGLEVGHYNIYSSGMSSECVHLLGNATISLQSDFSIKDLVITDPSDCHADDAQLTLELTSALNSQVNLTINGGIRWQAGTTFQNLHAGKYEISLRSKISGCTELISVSIGPVVNPEFKEIMVQKPSGCGNSDGFIIAEVAATDMFEYSLDNGTSWQSTPSFFDLSSDHYTLAIRKPGDSCHSVFGRVLDLTLPEEADIASVTTTPFRDCDSLKGQIEVVPLNNKEGIQYSLDGIAWSSEGLFSDLLPGNYQIFIRNTEVEDCQYKAFEVSVDSISFFDSNSVIVMNPTACDQADGSIIVSRYLEAFDRFSLNGSLWTATPVWTDLLPGTYELAIASSAEGCRDSIHVQLEGQSNTISASIVNLLHPSCLKAKDGYVSINGQGGVDPYMFLWSNHNTGDELANLSAGSYHVRVTDAINCYNRLKFELFDPPEFDPGWQHLQDDVLLCAGDSYAIHLPDSGVSYYWDLGDQAFQQGPHVIISQPGNYALTAVSETGCEDSLSFRVRQSESVFNAQFLVPTEGVVGEPIIAMEVSWPVPDWISWHVEGPGTVNLSEDFNQLNLLFSEKGTYKVILVARQDSCMSTVEKEISIVPNADQLNGSPSPSSLGISELIIQPNPNMGNFNVTAQLSQSMDVQVRIYNEQAVLVYQNLQIQVDTYHQNIRLNNPMPGVYNLLIQTEIGWKAIAVVIQ